LSGTSGSIHCFSESLIASDVTLLMMIETNKKTIKTLY